VPEVHAERFTQKWSGQLGRARDVAATPSFEAETTEEPERGGKVCLRCSRSAPTVRPSSGMSADISAASCWPSGHRHRTWLNAILAQAPKAARGHRHGPHQHR